MTAKALSHSDSIWPLLACATAYGAATGFFGPAFDTVVPDLVPAEELDQATPWIRSCGPRVLGPALGGILVAAVGASAAFALDAATFLVSIACISAIRYRARPAPREYGLGRELLGGLRYVAANPCFRSETFSARSSAA